ncbi:MAG: DEAD/DEAH box helicase [Caldilineales bacterium]|nr:DEAD/DEAH box helicase [Caldilineales bacterium]
MSQTFAELGLNPDRIAGLEVLGYEKPSKLQSEVIPSLLAGRDVVVEAPPGSGKTVAFVLPILQTLDPETAGVQVLVIVQNSNDALRISGVFQDLILAQHLHVMPVFEEQPLAREAERLDDATAVVVGTASRIKAHLDRGTFDLEQVQIAVLDSGDQLLADGQQQTIEQILDLTPGGRQTAIFATVLNADLQRLAEQFLFETVLLKREAVPVALPLIKHRYQSVSDGSKINALLRLLDGEGISRSLIFVNLGLDAEKVAQAMRSMGYHAAALSGNAGQEQRDGALRNWQEKSLDFLVLTDQAARGFVVETEFAISFDVPTDAETYASRVKLVAENGAHFSLVTPRERPLLSEIETFLSLRVKAVLPPTRADQVAQRTEAFKQRLRDAIARSNLEIYMSMLNELAKEGYDWSELAAAAVSLVQHSQTDVIYTRRTERRQTGSSSSPRSRESTRQRSEPQEEREVEQGYARLIMDAGYDIGVRPKDIVGAIANEANIPGRAVGNIDIRDRFTYVEVQEDYADRVLTRVPSTRLRGRVVTFRRA